MSGVTQTVNTNLAGLGTAAIGAASAIMHSTCDQLEDTRSGVLLAIFKWAWLIRSHQAPGMSWCLESPRLSVESWQTLAPLPLMPHHIQPPHLGSHALRLNIGPN